VLDLNLAGRPLDVATICARARVPDTRFLRLFRDGPDCVCAVLEAETAELLRRCWSSFSAVTGWADQLRAVAHTMLEFFKEDERRARLMAVDAHRGGERGTLIRDQGMQALFAFIDLGRYEMADPGTLTRTTAEAVGSSIYLQLRTWIEDGRIESMDELIPEMMYFAVLPYLGVEAAEAELETVVPRATGG
jgi:AcrR family transcriptional regulator